MNKPTNKQDVMAMARPRILIRETPLYFVVVSPHYFLVLQKEFYSYHTRLGTNVQLKIFLKMNLSENLTFKKLQNKISLLPWFVAHETTTFNPHQTHYTS